MNHLKNNRVSIKSLHLIIFITFIVPIALAYGLDSKNILSKLFDIKINTINLANIFRAMMTLYLGMSAIWVAGIVRPKFWIIATITNIVFMASLAAGRLLSLALDGLPSIYFMVGLLLELLLAFWGIKNLKKYPNLSI